MKPKNTTRILHLPAIIVLAFAGAALIQPAALAAALPLYWDTNGSTTSPAFGPATGTWGVDSFWTTSSNGSFADNRIVTTIMDTLIVSPNAVSTLTVSGAVSCDSIDLTNSGGNPLLTVSGGTSITLGAGASATAGIKTTGDGSALVSTPLILGSSATFINKTANGQGSLTISGGITGTSTLSLQGIKTLTISTNDLNNTGTVTNTNTALTTISANIGAAVTGVTQNSTNTMILSGTNSGFLGTFLITKGTLQFNSTAAFGGGAGDTVNVAVNGAVVLNGATNITPLLGVVTIASAGAIALNVNSNDAIDFNAAGLTAASLAASGSQTYSGTLTPQGGTYRLGGAVGTLTVSSATLTGSNALTVVGTTAGLSIVALTGANDYTGNTTLSSGYLNAGVAENENVSGPLGKQLKTAAGTIILNGGTLQYSAANQFDYSGRFSTAASQQYNIDTKGQIVTWAANLTSTGGSLTLNAPGTSANTGKLILTGTNEYAGVTTLNRYAGALSVSTIGNGGVAGNLGKATADQNNIVFNGRNITDKLFYTGDTASTDRGFIMGGDATAIFDITNAATTLTITGPTGNGSSGGIIKAGPGTLVLSGLSTRNPSNGRNAVSAGTLQFGKAQAIFTNNPVNWTTSHLVAASGATLAFNVGGTGEITTGNVTTLLTNLATSATNYGYASGDNITGDGMNSGSFLGFDTTNAGGTFTIGDVVANTTGTAGGARGLTKLGTNTLELTNTNTYTGATTVGAGTLLVNGSGSLASGSAVTVTAAGTLGGSGTIGGTVNCAGKIAPGASAAGTLTTGAVTLTGTLAVEIDGATGDKLLSTGAIDITAATLTVDLLAGGFTGPTYVIAEGTSLTGPFASVPSGYSVSYTSTQAILSQSGGSAYAIWSASLSNKAFDFDSDGNGIPNGLQWILGGTTSEPNPSAILPSVTASAAAGLTLVFTRNPDSIAETTLMVDWGSTLAPLANTLTIGTSSVGPSGNNPTIVIGAPTAGKVTVTIPAANAIGGKLFARLKATQP